MNPYSRPLTRSTQDHPNSIMTTKSIEEIKNDQYLKARYFGQYLFITEYLQTYPWDKRRRPHKFQLESLVLFEGSYYLDPIFFEGELTSPESDIKNCQLLLYPLSELSNDDAMVIFGKKGRIDKVTQNFDFIHIFIDEKGTGYDISLKNWNQLIEREYAVPILGTYDPFVLEWAANKNNY